MDESQSQQDIQVMTPSAVESIERAEIDVQIATAKKFPRPKSMTVIYEQILNDACGDELTASEMFYTLKRRGKTGMEIEIKGPSVRLSEICAYRFQNLHIAGRIIDHDRVNRTVTAQAVAWDLETNNRRSAELTENIVIGSSDGAKITRLAAIAKAERDAIFKVVPRWIWNQVVNKAITKSVGDAGTLAIRVSNAVKTFARWNVSSDQILSVFGLDSFDKFTQSDLGSLLGIYTAIKEGTSTIDEIFKSSGGSQSVSKGEQSAASLKVDTGTPAVSGVPPTPATVEETEYGIAAPQPRRGRPPGSKNKPASPVTAKTHDVESVDQAPKQEEKDDQSPFDDNPPRESAAETKDEAPAVVDPKSEVISEIRSKLASTNKSESRLLARLHEWQYTENPAATLNDVSLNDLTMISKRWHLMSTHL